MEDEVFKVFKLTPTLCVCLLRLAQDLSSQPERHQLKVVVLCFSPNLLIFMSSDRKREAKENLQDARIAHGALCKLFLLGKLSLKKYERF